MQRLNSILLILFRIILSGMMIAGNELVAQNPPFESMKRSCCTNKFKDGGAKMYKSKHMFVSAWPVQYEGYMF